MATAVVGLFVRLQLERQSGSPPLNEGMDILRPNRMRGVEKKMALFFFKQISGFWFSMHSFMKSLWDQFQKQCTWEHIINMHITLMQ